MAFLVFVSWDFCCCFGSVVVVVGEGGGRQERVCLGVGEGGGERYWFEFLV